ncbi:MAG: ZIP family metal transporter, partial [Halobacteriales archaeon]
MSASVVESFVALADGNTLVLALLAGFVIAFLNLIGASLVLVWRNPSERSLDAALGFAAGVMLAASFTSLILPGIDAAGGDPLPVLAGVVLGVALLDRADRWVPHVHFLVTGRRRDDQTVTSTDIDPTKVSGVVLFIVAITLHNMPEGLAVGVGFGSGDYANAFALMLAIG